MTCLERNIDFGPGRPVGSLTSEPAEIFKIIRKAWAAITDGNVEDPVKAASDFWRDYGLFCHRAPEWHIGELTIDDFKRACATGTDSAAGLDGWSARDIALLSDRALGRIVTLLNAIELGAPWPEHMLHTRSVFLSKDPQKTQDPLAYRVLKITSGWYRKWGSCRNRNLRDWILSWDCPQINSGVPSKGAQDAWYDTALKLELLKLSDEHFSGASVDVFKCFDQIPRPIIHKIASEAGMPSRILEPYMRYIDNLKVRYQVGEMVGDANHDVTSIPQGCPFSMTMVALLMLPWINKLQDDVGVQPRVLADDLLFTSEGKQHLQKTVSAFEESFKFFRAAGARVATNKCFTFSSDAASRRALGKHVWSEGNGNIPVKTHFRDLGAHLNVTTALHSTTLSGRLQHVIGMAKKLKWMAVDESLREKLVLSNLLPAALYGVEVVKVPVRALSALRSAIADAIGPRTGKRSVNLVFDYASSNKELDPAAYVLTQRVLNVRRMIVKHPGLKGRIALIIKKYKAYAGATKEKKPSLWDEANLCGEAEADLDVHSSHVFGPVGLLIDDLTNLDCSIGVDFVIHCNGQMPFNMLEMPWQHLKQVINDIVQRSRSRYVNQQRSFCGKIDELDVPLIKNIVNHMGLKEKHVLRHVSTGAAWGEHDLAGIQLSDGCCKHCGAQDVGLEHIHWDCPIVNQHRVNRELVDVRSCHLPKSVAYGLPPALSAKLDGPLWIHEPGECDVVLEGAPDVVKQCGALNQAASKQALLTSRAGDLLTVGSTSARECFASLKGELTGEQAIALPWRCTVGAPARINVYSDGSWLQPRFKFLGLGGAGVWWPNRQTSVGGVKDSKAYCQKVSEAEFDLAHFRQRDEGLQLFTKIGGYSGQSTRTEIAAGIIAICANGPIHLGSDSRAFVDKANWIINEIANNRDPQGKTHWKLTSDGDLWYHFCCAIKAKGPASVRISWVKGHASQDHIDAGVTSVEDKAGNDQADLVADEATALYGVDLNNIAKWYAQRAKAYYWFMRKVAHHIVEAYIIHRQLVEGLQEQVPLADRGTFYEALSYPEEANARSLIPHASIANYSTFKATNTRADAVEAFLVSLKVSTDANVRRVSWVELYILYVTRGFEVFDTPEHAALSQPTADKTIRRFKADVRAVVARTLPKYGDAMLFKPCDGTRDLLRGVGINGQCPALSCGVVTKPEERRVIARALVHLSRIVTDKSVDGYVDGERKFIPRLLTLNGKCSWANSIHILQPPCQGRILWPRAPPNGGAEVTRNVSFYTCKHCDKVVANSCEHFTYDNLDLPVRCQHSTCKKITRSSEWQCSCGLPWFTCVGHAKHTSWDGPRVTRRKRGNGRTAVSQPAKVPKRAESSALPLEAHPGRRGRKRPLDNSTVVLGDQQLPPKGRFRMKLGLSLSKRFCSAGASSH